MGPFVPALLGGLIIGVSAAALLLLNGRIAGISGIVGGLLRPEPGEATWRALFVLGLFAGGWLMAWLRPDAFGGQLPRSTAALVAAGLLVGVGVRLSSGCTSGHGLCGLSRFSRRALVATLTFMATGAAATFAVNRWLGGAL